MSYARERPMTRRGAVGVVYRSFPGRRLSAVCFICARPLLNSFLTVAPSSLGHPVGCALPVTHRDRGQSPPSISAPITVSPPLRPPAICTTPIIERTQSKQDTFRSVAGPDRRLGKRRAQGREKKYNNSRRDRLFIEGLEGSTTNRKDVDQTAQSKRDERGTNTRKHHVKESNIHADNASDICVRCRSRRRDERRKTAENRAKSHIDSQQ